MKRRLIIAASIILSLTIIASSVLAANFWTSTSVHKTITISTTSPYLDGAIISVESFSNYYYRTVPTDFPENYSDVRDNSFLVGINNTNLAGDVNITISATGVPQGMVVTAKMGYAAYYEWLDGFGYPESFIAIFFENETALGAYGDTYDGFNYNTIWQPLNMSAYSYPTLTLDTPYTIPAAHVPAATLDSFIPMQSAGTPTIDYCNGLWLQFQFDTSGVSDGTYNIYVTVSLDPA